MLTGINEEMNRFFDKEVNYLDEFSIVTQSKIFQEEINLNLFQGALGLAILGITKENKIFSFRKKIETPPFKMGFFKILKTNNFSRNKMIFDLKHITWFVLGLIVLSVVGVSIWMALSIDWSVVFN